jgi:hypothetical protein
LFNELSSKFDPGTKRFTVDNTEVRNILKKYCGTVGGVPNNFRNLLETGLLGDLTNPNGVVGQINGRLQDAESALLQIEAIVCDPGCS